MLFSIFIMICVEHSTTFKIEYNTKTDIIQILKFRENIEVFEKLNSDIQVRNIINVINECGKKYEHGLYIEIQNAQYFFPLPQKYSRLAFDAIAYIKTHFH
jgi:hypothetical protein